MFLSLSEPVIPEAASIAASTCLSVPHFGVAFCLTSFVGDVRIVFTKGSSYSGKVTNTTVASGFAVGFYSQSARLLA